MKNKIIQSTPLTLALLAIGFDYLSVWCGFVTGACYGTTITHIALSFTNPLYFFALYSLPLAIILIFVPRPVFNTWWKVAVLLLLIALLHIAATPVSPQQILSTGRDEEARFSAEVFTAISLILIIWKYAALRRANMRVTKV